MKKNVKYLIGIAFLAIGIVGCNNDDNLNARTLAETVTLTNTDVSGFLDTFTINDLEIFENGSLKDNVTELDIRFVKLNDDGTIPEEAKDITSGTKLIDLMDQSEADKIKLPFKLEEGSVNVTTSSTQKYFYLILRKGNGKQVYSRDPALIGLKAPNINSAVGEKDKLLVMSDSINRDVSWNSPASSAWFLAFDDVRSLMKSGVSEFGGPEDCFDGDVSKTNLDIQKNAGVGILIVPGTSTVRLPSSNNINSFAFVFTIINTERTDPDGDGILTKYEETEIDKDGNIDYVDTDKDGTPNYLDGDDDGDGVLTAIELVGTDLLKDLDEDEDEDCNGIVNDDFVLVKEDGVIPAYLDKDARE